jgi:hypothetical protein
MEEWKKLIIRDKRFLSTQKNLEMKRLHTDDSMDYASKNGWINILNWWVQSGLELKYSEWAFTWACYSKQFEVLNWWLNSGLEIKLKPNIVDILIYTENVEVLNWWIQHRDKLPFDYDPKTIEGLCKTGRKTMLDWFKNSGLKLNYPEYILDTISMAGQNELLTWFVELGIPVRYSENAITYASIGGNIETLDWWLFSKFDFKYDETAMDSISMKPHEYNRTKVLDWWVTNHRLFPDRIPELRYSEDAMDDASANGYIDVLSWWLNSGLELKYSNRALNWARLHGHNNVCDWWRKSGLIINPESTTSE